MLAVLLASVAAASCRFEGGAGLSADAGDGPGIDANDCNDPGDRDCDGIEDEDDNCPDTASADQHDDDNDGVGDVCDGCPSVADDQSDRDGDDVGDECDPEPDDGGDAIVLFEPFAGDRLDDRWIASGGLVQSNDELIVGVDGQPGVLLDTTLPTSNLAIEIGYTVVELALSGTNVIGPIVNYASDSGYWCGQAFSFQNAGQGTRIILYKVDGGDAVIAELSNQAPSIVVGERYRSVISNRAPLLECARVAGSNSEGTRTQAMTGASDSTFASPGGGLRVENMTARVHSLVVYQLDTGSRSASE